MVRVLVVAFTMFCCAGVNLAYADCTCRNKDGHKYQLGQMVCINIGDKSYLAMCEMDQNVTSWKKVHDSCPQALLSDTQMSVISTDLLQSRVAF